MLATRLMSTYTNNTSNTTPRSSSTTTTAQQQRSASALGGGASQTKRRDEKNVCVWQSTNSDKQYKVGDVVFRSKPFAWSLANRYVDKFCHYCCAPLPYARDSATATTTNSPTASPPPSSSSSALATIAADALKCLRCHVAHYCSAECKKLGWSLGGHRRECTVFQAWTSAYRPPPPPTTAATSGVASSENGAITTAKLEQQKKCTFHWLPCDLTRLILRLILKFVHGIEHNDEQECEPETETGFFDLLSHWPSERENDALSQQAMTDLHKHLDTGIPAEWHAERQFLQWNRLGEIFGRVMTNAFCIEEYVNLKLVGLSLYLCPAKIDHSCAPNTSYVMNGVELKMLCVEPFRGMQQARTSYLVDLTEPRDLRRFDLRRQWYFDCGCSACTDSERERRITAILCPHYECCAAMHVDISVNDSASTLRQHQVSDVKCSKCNRNDLISRYYLREALEVMDNMVAFVKSPKEMLFVGEQLLTRVTSFVHVSNGIMPVFLMAFLDALHQYHEKILTLVSKQRLHTTLLVLLFDSLVQTQDLWTKNYFCGSSFILQAFRHLQRFLATQSEQQDMRLVFSGYSGACSKFPTSTTLNENSAQNFALNSGRLLQTMQECFKLHFNDSSCNVMNELDAVHEPTVNKLKQAFC